MTTSPTSRLASLAVLAFLGACGTDSRDPPTGPGPRLTADLLSSDAPRFTDWSDPQNLGEPVNSSVVDQSPFISKDGLSLYFSSTRPGGFGLNDIWVSRRARVEDPWEPPENLGPAINTPFRENCPALSVDEHRLFVCSDQPGGSGGVDLYVSRRRDRRDDFGWGTAVNLGSTINTAASENSPAPWDDNGTVMLYFASDRPGLGSEDIYSSTELLDGTFSPAVLVEELSSPFRENAPRGIRRDGLEVYLASNRPGTVGNLDLWVATRARTSDPWSTPVNLDLAGNDVGNDGAPALSFDGTVLYFHAGGRPNVGGPMFDLWVMTRTKLRGPD